MTPKALAELLYPRRYRLGHEALLQEDVERVLMKEKIPYKREFRLSPADRVDFLVDGAIALELKIKAPSRSIYRQLQRYALHDQVESLVLMTLSAIGMPSAIEGKPVYVVSLGRSAL